MPSDNTTSDLALSLKSLENLDFGPKWNSSGSKPSQPRRESQESYRPHFKNFSGDRGPRRSFQKPLERKTKPEPELPIFNIQFFPEDVPFKVLSKAIRHSHKTYELFELARLILEKPERFSINIEKLHNLPSPSKVQPARLFSLYLSVIDGFMFDSQDDALSHILSQHASHFFQVEEQTAEAPKGQFPFIHCCGITGEPIGPPNYHRYSELLQAHHKEKIRGLSFERFLKSLKTEKSPEIQAAWLEKMQKQTSYRPLNSHGEAPLLTSPQEAKHYLLMYFKDKALKEQSSLSLPGLSLDKLSSSLRAAVQEALAQQRDFPLDMANHIRSRLRHYGFFVYKKGTKGITYVCSVKRKRREATTRFSASIQELIEFLDTHPLLVPEKVLEQFLGLEPGKDIKAAAKDNILISRTVRELEWLIVEGYVIQYSDGRLEAVAPLAVSEIEPTGPELAPSSSQHP